MKNTKYAAISFFPSDQLISSSNKINTVIKNKKYLNNRNVFIFGIKPTLPSNEYGYFLTKKIGNNLNGVVKFIEKPSESKAKKLLKRLLEFNYFLIRKFNNK